MHSDFITIQNLRAITRVGVPNSERGEPQEVSICLRLCPSGSLTGLGDEIGATVDYYQVSQRVLKVAADGERRLIETLAEDVATALLQDFELREVTVEIRKFILPETEYVAVSITKGGKYP